MEKGLHKFIPKGESEFILWIYKCSLTSSTLGLQTSRSETLKHVEKSDLFLKPCEYK